MSTESSPAGQSMQVKIISGETMADWLNGTMLVCACIGSLAFGILAAYALLRIGFGWMARPTRHVAVQVRPQVVRAS